MACFCLGSCQFALLVLLLFLWQASAGAKQNVTLAFLYPIEAHDDTRPAWRIESETAFRLAIDEVNSNPLLLPRIHVNIQLLDTGASQVRALESLAGAVSLGDSELEDNHIVSIIGTGYSAAARAPAMYASIAQIPMISPGSGWAGLRDKSEMPYFFRSIAPDSDYVSGLAEFAAAAGWLNVALLFDVNAASLGDDGTYQAFVEVAKRRGIRIHLQLSFDGRQGLESGVGAPSHVIEPLVQEMLASGCTVFLVYVRGVHMNTIANVARKLGMFSEKYVWLTSDVLSESPSFYGPGVVYPYTSRDAGEAENHYRAYAELWRARTSNSNGAQLWDNGDGVPDGFGSFVYDTVHMWAETAAKVENKHGDGSCRNGSLFREYLLHANYTGVTGRLTFAKDTQDRVSFMEFLWRPESEMKRLVIGKFATDGRENPVDVDWSLMGWTEGVPDDGSALSTRNSRLVSVPQTLGVMERVPVVMSLQNGFREPIVPTTALPDGLELRLLTPEEGEVANQEVTWTFEPNINNTDAFTTVFLSVSLPGRYLVSLTYQGQGLVGSLARLSVEEDGKPDATIITASIVGSLVGAMSVGGLFFFVRKHPEYAHILLHYLMELIVLVFGSATKLGDMVTDVLAGVGVINSDALEDIAPWYLVFLAIAGVLTLVEIYYIGVGCLGVKKDVKHIAQNTVMHVQLKEAQNRRDQRMALLSLLNCIAEDIPMAVMNTIIITRLPVEELLVYEISVAINFLMIGWKMSGVRVLHQLRRERVLLHEYCEAANRVQEAATHTQKAVSLIREDTRRESVRERLRHHLGASANHLDCLPDDFHSKRVLDDDEDDDDDAAGGSNSKMRPFSGANFQPFQSTAPSSPSEAATVTASCVTATGAGEQPGTPLRARGLPLSSGIAHSVGKFRGGQSSPMPSTSPGSQLELSQQPPIPQPHLGLAAASVPVAWTHALPTEAPGTHVWNELLSQAPQDAPPPVAPPSLSQRAAPDAAIQAGLVQPAKREPDGGGAAITWC